MLIIDGIDHVWRTYQKVKGYLTEKEETILEIINQISSTNPNVSIVVLTLLYSLGVAKPICSIGKFVFVAIIKSSLTNIRIKPEIKLILANLTFVYNVYNDNL